jgi:signal transduction histidine kinase
VIILILILTNIILTYFVSRSITKPLYYLKKAANEIKNGNLNFEVKYKSKDEIGELSSAFEEMRVKLKESIEMEQQYEQNRKELVSNISHDLKTPITAVKGYVEGIIDGVADNPDKMDKYIKTIYTKTNEIDLLIDELFLYSKLDLKKLAFSFERVNIRRYLEHFVEEFSFDLESKGIKLSYEANCEDKTLVIADREKLNRVITNIVYNSVKYMDLENGKIDIKLEEEDNDVVVGITDNGQGISESNLPHIFDKFYRADPARNTQKGGSGLGLSIAKHIIEEHGGRIWAQSKLGVGTTIAFTLKKTGEF